MQFHSSVGMTAVHLLDTHIMRTTTCLDLKAQDQMLPFVLLNTVRHFQVLDLNAGCILIHHQAGEKKRESKVNTCKNKLPFASNTDTF